MDIDIKSFIARGIEILGKNNLLQESGALLYSSYDTLKSNAIKEGKIYLLGTNPGGNPEKDNMPTIEDHLRDIPKKKNEYNEYKCGEWIKEEPGKHKIQIRVQSLMESLNLDITKICASNLIFKRTSNLNKMSLPEFRKLADACWEVHRLILDLIQPKVIIAFGNGKKSPYEYLMKFRNPSDNPYIMKKSGHVNYWCKVYRANIENQEITVIGFPHFTYYNIESIKNEDRNNVINWAKKWINAAIS